MKTQRDVDKWFTEQVLPHERDYLSLAQRLMGDRESAQDAVQEAYQEIVAGDTWGTVSNPRAYMKRVVHNRCVTRLRIKKIPTSAMPETDSLALSDPLADPFAALAMKEQLELASIVLRRMPLQLRRVFLLRRVEGLSHAEISQTLKINERTVRKHMEKAQFLFTKSLAEVENPKEGSALWKFKLQLRK